MKTTDNRAPEFEERFGEGATELDALEALHPDLLRQILMKEIERYWDRDHDDGVDDACRDIEHQLEEITEEIHAEHQDEIDALEAEWQEIASAYQAWVQLAKPVWQAIADKCDINELDLDDVEWCPPFDADEDPDPLYDSTRDYVEQIDRFKLHQGKPTERREVVVRPTICAVCGTPFEAKYQAKSCSQACRTKLSRLKAKRRNASAACHATGEMCDGQPEAGGAS
jgi:hypothetical protein